MSRATFSAGLYEHQANVAVWARKRLVDRGGRSFEIGRSEVPQHGVIAADGVGLGKTWEALAASALILVERGKERKGGGKRKNVRRQPARVLVICPPGLVSKWSREIRDPEGFSAQLQSWAGTRLRRQFVLETLTTPFEIRRRSDLPQASVVRAGLAMPAGTYVCNWNVLRRGVGSGRSRLAALRAQPWDVVIVDEAHHREAREAINAIRWRSPMLLLTATPFQLEPREIHDLLRSVLDAHHGEHKVLARAPLRPYVEALSRFFEGGAAPLVRQKKEAERVLRQVIARSDVKSRGRRHFLIADGARVAAIPSPDRLRERDLQGLVDNLIEPAPEFEEWYLQRRFRLADGDRTFLPTKLRQALSTPRQALAAGGEAPPMSPRLDALVAWVRRQAEADLLKAARDGRPRKLLVFTSFVGGAARELKQAVAAAFHVAWNRVRTQRAWRDLAKRADRGVEQVVRRVRGCVERDEVLARSREAAELLDAVASLRDRDGDPFTVLFGHPTFRRFVVADLRRRLDALALVLREADRDEGWWARLHREERRSLRATIRALGRSDLVATYTGHDDRRERDAAGEAFRTPLAPWALVASNVGSEGIDLHTFSAHLVHFDIEWNPARMEQREGRSDRLGRKLHEPVNVYYVLVRGTYDERMLHQLVARQRWHGVLLGRPGARLARDREGKLDVRWLEIDAARKFALNLRPAIGRRG
jgi:hypothetical protein